MRNRNVEVSRRDLVRFVAGGLLAIPLLAACGGSAATSGAATSAGSPASTTASGTAANSAASSADTGSSAGVATKPAGKGASLQWMVWGDDWSNKVEKEATSVWAQANPGSSVEVLNKGGDHFQTLLTMLAGGTPPDASIVDGYNEPEIITRGTIVELSPYAQKTGIDKADYDANQWNENSCGGKLYSFPNMRCYNVVMYYNKDLFQKAGVAFPTPSWTWDDFVTACQKLTVTQGGQRVQWGTLRTGYWWPFVWMNGGEMYANDQLTQVAVDQPAATESLQWLADLVYKNHVAPTAAEAKAAGGGNLFFTGKSATEFQWGTDIANVRRAPETVTFDWDIAPVPSGKNGSITVFKGNGAMLFKGGKQIDQAWDLLRTLGSEGSQQVYASYVRQIPMLKKVAQSDSFLKSGKKPAHMEYLVNPPKSRNLQLIAEWNRMEKEGWGPGLSKLWAGQTTAQEAMTQQKQAMDTIMAGHKSACAGL